MNTNTQKLGTLIAAGFLMSMAGLAQAAPILDVTYDFGTEPGKTTYQVAGFTEVTTTGTSIVNVADGVSFSNTAASGFVNAGLLRTFTGLGGSAKNDFIISTTFTVNTLDATPNNERPISIQLFSPTDDDAGINSAGISLQVRGVTGADNDAAGIRLGVNGGTTYSSASLGYDIVAGDVFTLTGTGTFTGNNLGIVFSIVRNGGTAQTVSHNFVDFATGTVIDNTFFGVSSRYKQGTTSTLDTFSLQVIPEPSTLALLGIALGSLVLFRRRK